MQEYSVTEDYDLTEEVWVLFKDDFWYSYWALVISVMITIGLLGYFVRSPLMP